MPCVGFEPTIPAYERAKTIHALRLLGYCDVIWVYVSVIYGKVGGYAPKTSICYH
jgi:hypothetical protein